MYIFTYVFYPYTCVCVYVYIYTYVSTYISKHMDISMLACIFLCQIQFISSTKNVAAKQNRKCVPQS